MKSLLTGIGYLSAGVLSGSLSAYVLIQSAGIEPVQDGSPWQSRAAGLADTLGYYVRLHYLVEGRLPPAPGQLMEATAQSDGDGQPLSSACRYRLEGKGPLPAWWSLSVIDGGAVITSRQTIVDASAIIAEPDGSLVISASETPQPGNWLRTPEARRYTLLYSAYTGRSSGIVPPFTISRTGCR
jgi:hypothetical protein